MSDNEQPERTATLASLTAGDIGRRVRVRSRHATVDGILETLLVETDWITEQSLSQHPDDAERVPGRRTAHITVGEWDAVELPLDTPVEVWA